jgi:hypothetical protein
MIGKFSGRDSYLYKTAADRGRQRRGRGIYGRKKPELFQREVNPKRADNSTRPD